MVNHKPDQENNGNINENCLPLRPAHAAGAARVLLDAAPAVARAQLRSRRQGADGLVIVLLSLFRPLCLFLFLSLFLLLFVNSTRHTK